MRCSERIELASKKLKENQRRKIKQALCYLEVTFNEKLILDPGFSDQLRGYVDASCGGESGIEECSRCGILMKYGNAPIILTILLQKSVSFGISEADYFTTFDAGHNMKWLQTVSKDLETDQPTTELYQKNGAGLND